MLYNSLSKGPYKVIGAHDPDSIRTMAIVLRPPERANSTVYYLPRADAGDIVIPSTFTGVYYEVKNPGKSAAAEPTMATVIDAETEDGSVLWVTKPYNMMIPGVTISIGESPVTCTATEGVTVSSITNTETQVQFTIDAIPELATARSTLSFDVHLHIILSDGDAVDMTIRFKVAER
jgi:hypothetical protein